MRIAKKTNKESYSSDCNRNLNLYCIPAILGDRHCCPSGNIWKQNRLGQWQCTGSQGCENIGRGRIGNCINAIGSTLRQESQRGFSKI